MTRETVLRSIGDTANVLYPCDSGRQTSLLVSSGSLIRFWTP